MFLRLFRSSLNYLIWLEILWVYIYVASVALDGVYGGHISVLAITEFRVKMEFASARVPIRRAFNHHCLVVPYVSILWIDMNMHIGRKNQII